MEQFMAKLSSYNLLNYLLTGVVFSFLAEKVAGRVIVPTGLLVAVFVYYFVGLVVSRFGSVVVEPALKALRVIEFCDYAEFVAASKNDPKLDVLSEQNNVYRSLVSALVLLLLLGGWGWLVRQAPLLAAWQPWLLLVGLLTLFLLSYRKQTTYVTKRVRADAP